LFVHISYKECKMSSTVSLSCNFIFNGGKSKGGLGNHDHPS